MAIEEGEKRGHLRILLIEWMSKLLFLKKTYFFPGPWKYFLFDNDRFNLLKTELFFTERVEHQCCLRQHYDWGTNRMPDQSTWTDLQIFSHFPVFQTILWKHGQILKTLRWNFQPPVSRRVNSEQKLFHNLWLLSNIWHWQGTSVRSWMLVTFCCLVTRVI